MAQPAKQQTAADYKLYEIASELSSITRRLEENGGVIDEETEAELENWLELEREKVARCIAYIQQCQELAEGAKAEKKRLNAVKKRLENSAKSLKDYIAHQLWNSGFQEVETELGKVKAYQHHTPPLEMKEGVTKADVDEAFLKTIPAKQVIDKDALREALESDNEELKRKAQKVAYLGEATIYARIF